MSSISQLITSITQQLKIVSDTPHLDAELLLMYVLQCSKSFLFAHSEKELTAEQLTLLEKLVQRRKNNEPIAYILGEKEFWSLPLKVTPDVLIPRPETENLVEWMLDRLPEDEELLIADLGVGSGAIAIALAYERPNWKIHATDQSFAALTIAEENAKNHHLKNIKFFQGSWCTALPEKNYDAIVSNPPYIANNDPHLKNLGYEPQSALNGGKEGLEAIQEIIQQAKNYLIPQGFLILEHGYDQKEKIQDLLKNSGYQNIQDFSDYANLPRFIVSVRPR